MNQSKNSMVVCVSYRRTTCPTHMFSPSGYVPIKIRESGLPTSRLQSKISDFLLYCRLFYYFLYMLETKTFLQSHHKTTSKPPRIQKILLYFTKDFCDSKQNREKRPHPAGSSCAWTGLWHVVKCTLSTSRSFQTFFKHKSSHHLLIVNSQSSSLFAYK